MFGVALDDVVLFAVGVHAIGGVVRGGGPVSGARGRAGSVGWVSLNPVEREDYFGDDAPAIGAARLAGAALP
jgi:hypothetical protein